MQLRYTVEVIFVKTAPVLAAFLLLAYFPFTSYAQQKIFLTQSQLQEFDFKNYESINTNQIIYPFKTIWENLGYYLILNSKRNYLLNLYHKRFKELVYIINYDKTGFLPETVDRYNTFAGRMKNQSQTINEDEKKFIIKNLRLLEKLRDRYHSGSAYWVKIQEAVDTTKSLI